MKDQYLCRTIQRAIKPVDLRPGPVPTFAGEFVPDLINKLKAHLREVELAQIRAVQQEKEVCRSQATRRPTSKVWEQIERARRSHVA